MVEGRYFLPRSTRFVAARALAIEGRTFRILGASEAVLAEFPAAKLRVSARLGRLARRIECPDGSRFESEDNDGIDALCRSLRLRGRRGLVDRMERSLRWIAAAVVAAIMLTYVFVTYGIPAVALHLARVTPPAVADEVSRQTLKILDGVLVHSELSVADKEKAERLFALVASNAPRGKNGYHLLFRKDGSVANAFALPDGSIVMTDALWRMVRDDGEIEGVFAHEMSHVDRAHGLQRAYQASLVPAAIAVLTGDASQVGQLATVLPGILLQSAYSQRFEQEADDDAAVQMRRMGIKPSHMGDLLERLEAENCGKEGCLPSWLGSHPETDARVSRLHDETIKGGDKNLR